MKPAANTSVSDQNTIQPSKTGALLGKLGQMKSTAMAAVAALGLASSAEAENVRLGTGLSHSTISSPVKISGLANEANSWTGDLNSRLSNGNAVIGLDTSKSRFTLTLSTTDIGAGGTLTITGNLQLSTQPTSTVGGISMGISNTTYDLKQQAQWGKAGDAMTTIVFIDSPLNMQNDSVEELNSNEAWFSGLKPFSVNIPVTSSGTYYLENVFTRRNISGGAEFRDFTINYKPFQDSNINSIPDSWEIKYLGNLLSPAEGDPDNDGQTNLLEYAMNTDPMKANPSPITCALEDGEKGEKYLTLSFPRNPLATNLNYTVEGSNDLKLWGEVKKVTDITQTTVTDIVPVSSTPTRFLRLKIDPK